MRFRDKAIVITGGSSGIGLVTAQRIAAEGGRALVTGTNAAKLDAARAGNILTFENDAADPEAAEALAAEVKRVFGAIDGAFLNAGVGGGAPLDQITSAFYRNLIDLNVGGVLFGAKALAPLIREGGSILVTASAAKDKGIATAALYSATKGAVRSLVKGLARELLPRRIRVNSVSPGPIDTPFFERLGIEQDYADLLRQHIDASNPMGRIGTSDEVAAVAAFLLSDEASYVTGADYAVDGGEAQL